MIMIDLQNMIDHKHYIDDNKIPKNSDLIFNITNDETEDTNECTICLENLIPEKICITNCNHTFCHQCLDDWIDKKKYYLSKL